MTVSVEQVGEQVEQVGEQVEQVLIRIIVYLSEHQNLGCAVSLQRQRKSRFLGCGWILNFASHLSRCRLLTR